MDVVAKQAACRLLRQALTGALLLGCSIGPVLAQAGGNGPFLERPAELDCVVPVGEPQTLPLRYPFLEYKEGTPGRVKLEMHFTSRTLKPAVKVLESEGGYPFVAAARAYADNLRMPCLQVTEAGVRVVQDYIFKPDVREPVQGPVDMANAGRRKELLACLKQPNPTSDDYPRAAMRRSLQGRVLVEAEFNAPDQPPKLTPHHRPSAGLLVDAAKEQASLARLPCFVAGEDEPLKVSYVFVYVFEGQAFGFQPMTLLELLPSVKGIRQQHVKLDTRAMGCPFELRWSYRKPHLSNVVGELGDRQASREPLLQWLRSVELALPAKQLDWIYGDTADIAVPCINIDIKPTLKETS